jgi:hypothetical protein
MVRYETTRSEARIQESLGRAGRAVPRRPARLAFCGRLCQPRSFVGSSHRRSPAGAGMPLLCPLAPGSRRWRYADGCQGVPGRQVVVATQQQTDSVRPRGRGRRHPAGPGSSSCGRRGGPDQAACSPAARGLRSGNLPALVLIGGMHGGQRVPVHDAVPQRGQSPASPSRSCPCRPCPPGRHRAARGGRRRTRRPVVVEVPLVWMVQLIRWPGCFMPSASSAAALPRNKSRHRGPSRNRR